jgi:hypothetical protein
VVHAQPKALEHRGQVPGINRSAIHGCLTTHRVQPGAIQKSRQQWVTNKSLVHPGDSRGGASKRVSDTRFGEQRSCFGRMAEHAFLPPNVSAGSRPDEHASATYTFTYGKMI